MWITLSNQWDALDRLLRSSAPRHYLLAPWFELALVAALFTLLLLLLMKLIHLDRRVRRLRRAMLANLYAMRLYCASPRAVMVNELRLIGNNLKLLAWLSPVLLIGGLFFAAFYHTLSDRYGTAPLPVGQPFVVRMRSIQNTPWRHSEGAIEPISSNLKVEAVVRVPAVQTVWSRLHGDTAGQMVFQTGATKDALGYVNIGSSHFPPRPLQRTGDVEIAIAYPSGRWWGWSEGWMVYFLGVCLIAGIPLSRLLKIQL